METMKEQTKMVNLKGLIKSAEDLARQMLLHKNKHKRVKQLTPMFHLVSPDANRQDLIIGCEWANANEKYMAIAAVKEKAHEIGAVAAMFITEAWMAKYDKDHTRGINDPPSENPNRIEIVIAIAIDNDGHQESATWQIVRDKPGGSITALVEECLETTAFQANIIDGLLPPKKS